MNGCSLEAANINCSVRRVIWKTRRVTRSVTAYAALRPDGQWSLLVVNRDQWNDHKVRIAFHDTKAKADRFFSGPVTTTTFGRAQYQWHPDAKGGSADPDGPAATRHGRLQGRTCRADRLAGWLILTLCRAAPCNRRRRSRAADEGDELASSHLASPTLGGGSET